MEQLSRIVGDNLKRLRAEQGLSLDALSRASGVSKSRLGQIERGEANPSISTVWQIANALKVEFSAIVTSPATSSVVVRRANLEPMADDDGRYRNYSLFPFDAALGFDVFTVEIDPGGQLSAEPHPEGTLETLTVTAGQIEIVTAGERHLLGTGDAIRFKADAPHSYLNSGDTLAVVGLVLAYPRAT